jgi:hypothetical protein
LYENTSKNPSVFILHQHESGSSKGLTFMTAGRRLGKEQSSGQLPEPTVFDRKEKNAGLIFIPSKSIFH